MELRERGGRMINLTYKDQAKKRSSSSVLSTLLPLLTLSVGALLAATGCTSKSNQSKISLTLPDFAKVASSTSSTVATTHIRIQVTGAGIDTPITFAWDTTDASPTAPKEVPLTIPSGANRIIQVLAANQDTSVDDAPIAFVYGDATQTLSADGDVAISMAAVAPVTTKNGTIAGRYLRANLTAPTGRVLVQFPVAGKPSMLLTRQEIFGGWFRFFSVENVPLTYVLESTGEELISNASVTSASLLATDDANTPFNETSRTALISLPPYYSTKSNSGSTYSFQAGSSILVGFFGPGAGTRAACYPAAGTNLYYTATTSDPSTALNYTWAGNSVATGTQGGVTSGGALSSSTICTASVTQFTDHLSLNAAYLANRDQLLGYSGPFQILGTTGASPVQLTSYTITSGAGAAVLNWQLLPNVIKDVLVPAGIEGLTVYKREGVASVSSGKQDYQIDDGYACGSLEAKGFTKVQSLALTPGVTAGSVTITGINALNYQAGKFQAVICPYRTELGVTTYFSSAADFRASAASGVSYRVSRSDASALDSQAVGECIPYKAYLVDSSGNQSVSTTAKNLEVIASSFGGYAYTDAACTTVIAPTTSASGNGTVIATSVIAAGAEASSPFYIKSSTASRSVVGVYDQSSFLSGGAIAVRTTGEAAGYGLQFNASSSPYVAGSCYPLTFAYVQSGSSDFSIPIARSQDQQLTISSTNAGSFFANANCSVSLAQPFTVTAGQTSLQLYYSPTAANSTLSFSVTGTTVGTPSMSLLFWPSGSVGTGNVAAYSATVGNSSSSLYDQYTSTECKLVTLKAVNELGTTITLKAAKTVTLTSSAALMYSDSSCTTTGASTKSFTIPAYNFGTSFYIHANSGAASISISGSDSASLLLPPKTLTLDAPAVVTLARTSGASALTSTMSNNCYALTASLKDASGNAYSTALPYSITIVGVDHTTATVYADAACSISIPSGIVTVASYANQAAFFATFSSTSSKTRLGFMSSRATPLVVNSTEADYVDVHSVLAAYTGSSGSGTLTLKTLDSNGLAVTNLPDPLTISVNLGGNFTVNGNGTTHLLDVSISQTAGYSQTNIGGGTATSQLTATPLATGNWKGAVTVPSNLLTY